MGPFNDFGLSLMEMRSNGDSQAVKRNNPNYALNIFLDTMFVSNFRRMKEITLKTPMIIQVSNDGGNRKAVVGVLIRG